ncbi:hypothetical protein BDY21DRAFT_205753 [Lineolata rhizophorae]|uniref:Distal membrane-arm assembly complex protein 1-like domain-containing protein n=1 Tax=Lineolata rhizophorae TaxID=578093 RepID=A0A6A6P3H3_9PEZI|nr:hypothetical protein BDY21DRAFT_205753 [Lineolata rhizophorae]
MSKDIQSLQKPPKLEDALAAQRAEFDDCLPCRLMGSAAFVGLGAYSWISGHSQLNSEEMRARAAATAARKGGRSINLATRKLGVKGISLALVGMGLWRLVN